MTKHIPVRMDWSTRRVVDLMEMILISAGTLSPTSVHITNTYTKAGPSLTFVSLVIYWFGSITVQRQSDCSVLQLAGGGGEEGGLVLALWMDSVVVENRYHSKSQRERETLGRS